MKCFSAFCLSAAVMAGALLLFASCKKENPAPAPDPTPAPIDLSASGTANCYIVSAPGIYYFKATKGNSNLLAGDIEKAEVLWESFGTSAVPDKGSIISSVSYADNYVTFTTPLTLRNGNAVIAVRGPMENILWSWHIWVCQGYNPDATGQVYSRSAGTMMDRNLGATSSTPGAVESFGLLYQWGRKDPFLGSSSLEFSTLAKSTIDWPTPVSSADYGNVNVAVGIPTTFIYASTGQDWVHGGPDNTLWAADKTIYDPCPYGWKVPAGGDNGVWATAAGSADDFKWTSDFDNDAMNLSGKLGDAGSIWYQAAGCRGEDNGNLSSVGVKGHCWSITPNNNNVYTCYMYFASGEKKSSFYPKSSVPRAAGYSVRCVKE